MGFIDTEFQEHVSDVILMSALKQYAVQGINIVDNSNIYKVAGKLILKQKMDRCKNVEEYIYTLKRNIYYYANTSHRYDKYLRKMIPHNIPSGKALSEDVGNIQIDARNEVKQSILVRNDSDAIVSTINIMKAEDMPMGNRESLIKKLDTLENIYQKMSVENDTLINTIGLLALPDHEQRIFKNRLSEIDSDSFFDYYFMRLKGFIEICANDYPSICDRI